MKCSSSRKLFTAQQEAAILRLYVKQCLPSVKTAKRLQLPVSTVIRFLRKRSVMRPQGIGGGPRKISPARRQELESELATTNNAVLARKYGVVRDTIRQIRQRLGYPSSRIIRRTQTLRALAERQRQQKLARQERLKARLSAINRLSKRWKCGALVSELAREFGVKRQTIFSRIQYYRKRFPKKFPRRSPERVSQ